MFQPQEHSTTPLLRHLRNRPDEFLRLLRDHIGFKTRLEGSWGKWDIEERVFLDSFDTPETKQIFVRAGNATGKTASAGLIGAGWLFCRQPSKVIYLSTKREQAKTQAWAEFLGLYTKIWNWCKDQGVHFPDPMVERVDLRSDWWARVYAGQVRGDKSKSTGWSGFHGKYLLYVIDEALGIPNNVWEMVKGCITSRHNLALCQANPISRGTDGYDWWYKGQQEPIPEYRKVYQISSKTSPNYLFEKWAREHFDKHGEWPDDPHIRLDDDGEVIIEELIPGLADYGWISEIEADPETKPGTPFHDSHILGRFALYDEWGLIPWKYLIEAADRAEGWEACIEGLGFDGWSSLMQSVGRDEAIGQIQEYAQDNNLEICLPDFNRLAFGLDVADTGGNLSVLTVLAGDKVLEQRTYDVDAATVLPGAVWKTLLEYECITLGIDKPGVGAGPTKVLREMGAEVLEYKGGIPVDDSDDRQEYKDLNAMMGWKLRQKFTNGEIEIPNNDPLLQQCSGIRYTYTEGTKVKIPKPSKSPDRFDSLRIALWVQQFGDYAPNVLDDQLPRQRDRAEAFIKIDEW